MGWTRLIRPPAPPRRRRRPGKPRRTRRIPSSGLRGRRGARRGFGERAGWPFRGRSSGRRRSRRRRPLRRRWTSRGVAPRGYHATGDDPGLGATHHHDGEHVHDLGTQRSEVRNGGLLCRAVGVPYDTYGRIRRSVLQKHLLHLAELPVAALRAGVVERDDEVAFRSGFHPTTNNLPRREQVGEADRTVVMPEW